MIFGSVCSGIEAASVAWEPLGWRAAWFAEIEDFASTVLSHHFPSVPNLGDFTKIGDDHGTIELLVGGTPCQSFSIAGRRAGLDDPRGNLTLEFLSLARRVRARWLVWENVPGILSDDGGRTFGTFLGLLGELGYGFAYRVLDAQHFGVPQRRRRVFVVGCLGSWQRACAVLFERASLSGNPAPSREARAGVAGTLAARSGDGGKGYDADDAAGGHLVADPLTVRRSGDPQPEGGNGIAIVCHPLRADGHDASEDGTGRGVPLLAHTLPRDHGSMKEDGTGRGVQLIAVPQLADPVNCTEGKTYTHEGRNNFRLRNVIPVDVHGSGNANSLGIGKPGGPAAALDTRRGTSGIVAFDTTQITHPENRSRCDPDSPSPSLPKHAHAPAIAYSSGAAAVRRLTPRECERLQGFPDDFTLIRYRGKPARDGPRYRALGNSMAVPVMRWIGERIELVERLDRGARSTLLAHARRLGKSY